MLMILSIVMLLSIPVILAPMLSMVSATPLILIFILLAFKRLN